MSCNYRAVINSYGILVRTKALQFREYLQRKDTQEKIGYYVNYVLNRVTRVRIAAFAIMAFLGYILLGFLPQSQEHFKKFHCFGPAMSPADIDPNMNVDWHPGVTPLVINTHQPMEMSSNISVYDLNVPENRDVNKDRVLILTPLKDSAHHLHHYFELISELTYPHELIDIAFLVSDSDKTDTEAILARELNDLQESSLKFRSAQIFKKDFHYQLSNDVTERHSFAAQAPRRKILAQARNFLLYSALKPDHGWVMWRDVDVEEAPETILQDFIKHDRDVLCPNIWFHRFDDKGNDIEGRFDYNAWIDSDKARQLAASLDPDLILVEGYKEYQTDRDYMARKGDWRWDKDEEIELDGVGGVSLMVRADVHRSGINFPAYSFEHQAETEGFAKMAKRAGYSVIGLPNYVVWHFDTAEEPGNA